MLGYTEGGERDRDVGEGKGWRAQWRGAWKLVPGIHFSSKMYGKALWSLREMIGIELLEQSPILDMMTNTVWFSGLDPRTAEVVSGKTGEIQRKPLV